MIQKWYWNKFSTGKDLDQENKKKFPKAKKVVFERAVWWWKSEYLIKTVQNQESWPGEVNATPQYKQRQSKRGEAKCTKELEYKSARA